MTIVGCFGVFFNLASFIFYARQKCHRTFHRFVFATSSNVIERANITHGKFPPKKSFNCIIRTDKTFERWKLSVAVVSSMSEFIIQFSRLLLLLGIADIIHIVSSLLSFSLPAISPTFLSSTAYLHSLPYTLPMAQVIILSSLHLSSS